MPEKRDEANKLENCENMRDNTIMVGRTPNVTECIGARSRQRGYLQQFLLSLLFQKYQEEQV